MRRAVFLSMVVCRVTLAQQAGTETAAPEAAPAPTAPAAAPTAPTEPAAPAPTRIVVEVTGLRSDKGQHLIWLFTSEKGFPDKVARARYSSKTAIAGGKTVSTFDVTPGEYAVSTCHDENGNGECDTNFLGIPKEGVACSNDAHKKNMIPKYDKARLTVSQGQTLKVPVGQITY